MPAAPGGRRSAQLAHACCVSGYHSRALGAWSNSVVIAVAARTSVALSGAAVRPEGHTRVLEAGPDPVPPAERSLIDGSAGELVAVVDLLERDTGADEDLLHGRRVNPPADVAVRPPNSIAAKH